LLSHEEVYIGYIEGILKRLNRSKPKEVEDELTLEEINDLLKRIKKVIKGVLSWFISF
jgi:C4-type Zn-finger protein